MFRSAMVRGESPEQLVRQCCTALSCQSEDFNFGVIYINDVLGNDAEGIVEGLKLGTGITTWVGCVAMGVLSNEGECFGEPAVAVMVGRLPDDSFMPFASSQHGWAGESPQCRAWMQAHSPHVALTHADPRSPEVAAEISQLGKEMFVLGGLVSSRNRYAHIAQKVYEGGVSGVFLTPKVVVATRLSQGCRPLGPRHLITRGAGQLIQELDHRGAVQVLEADLAQERAKANIQSAPDAGGIHVAITVSGDDSGDYLVRNLLGIEQEHTAVVVGDEIETGQSIMFCRRDAHSAQADLEQMLHALRRRLPSAPKGAIYVSCLARGPNLFSQADLETDLIKQIMGEIPMVGFFANGEFARDRIYGYTGVLTVFC